MREEKQLNNWIKIGLGDACEIFDGLRKPINAKERAQRIINKNSNELYPYYGATGQVGFIDDFIFKGQYILLGEDGAPFLDPYKNKAYLVNGRFWVNNHAHILKAHISNKFICFYLNYIDYSKYVTGTTRLKLNQSALKKIQIPFPPLNEQKKIVETIEELFSELDKGLESLKKAEELLELFESSLIDSVVNGFSLDRNIHEKPIKNALQYELSKLISEIGQGWSPKCINQPSKDVNEWCVIKTTAIQHFNFLEFENKILPKTLEPRNHLEIVPGDILITRAGPKNRVGVACLVKKCRSRLILCDKAYRLKVNQEIVLPEYLELLLNSPKCQDQIQNLKTGINDSGVNLTQNRFLNLTLPIPSIEHQNFILQKMKNTQSIIENSSKAIKLAKQKINSLRQSILQKAFSGQLVPQNPNDEPACVLLERIKAEQTIKKNQYTKPKKKQKVAV